MHPLADKQTAQDFGDRFGFPCQECHEMGYGSCYNCANGCDYQLHEECWTAPTEAYYSFFAHRRFTLLRQQLPNYTRELCTACGMAVQGLMYASTFENGLTVFLHPCCMKLPHRIEIDDDGGDMDRFSIKRGLRSLSCQYCGHTSLQGPVDGWAYVSADQQTACHVKCMKERLYDAWLRYTHGEEPQGVDHETWLINDFDHGLEQCVDSTSSTPSRAEGSGSYRVPSRPGSPSQGPHNNLALRRPRPRGGKRLIFWKLTKVAIKVLFHVAIGNPVGVFGVVQDLF